MISEADVCPMQDMGRKCCKLNIIKDVSNSGRHLEYLFTLLNSFDPQPTPSSMTYTVFFLTARLPGTSFEHFRDHYEHKHIPLVLEVLKDVLPLSHTRYYLKRNDNAEGAPPLVLMGDVSTIDYDCLTIIEFRDEEHFGQFNQAYMTSPRKEEMEKDQARRSDPEKFRVIAVDSARATKF